MAQLIVSWFVDDGRFQYTPSVLGRRKGRIIEVEEVDTRERLHGSAQVGRLVQARSESDVWIESLRGSLTSTS